MDAISEQRMKEIQEEMNRFESEISATNEQMQPPPAPFHFAPTNQHTIPSNQQQPSFQQPHQQHFHHQQPMPNHPRPPPHLMSHIFNQQQQHPQFNQQQPPFNQQHPPFHNQPQQHPQFNSQQQPQHPPFNHPNMYTPGPFPQMFVPPQLRNRPTNPPPRPPLAFGQHPFNLHIPPSTIPPNPSPSISAPKVVYSAPPVKNTILVPPTTTTPPTPTKTTPTTTSIPTTTSTSVVGGGGKEVKNSWKRVGDCEVGDDRAVKVAKIELTTTIGSTKTTTKTKTTTPATTAPTTTPSTTAPTTIPLTTTTKPPSSKDPKNTKDNKKKKFVRMAAGNAWEDNTLNDWDTEDFRIFCGDLGNEVTDDVLIRVFNKFPSFQKARVIRDKRTNKTKGYGFASFKDPNDFMNAIKEVNGKYVGNRPIKLKKSCWQDRQLDSVKKRDKDKKRLGYK